MAGRREVSPARLEIFLKKDQAIRLKSRLTG